MRGRNAKKKKIREAERENLQLGLHVQQVPHLPPGPIRVEVWVGPLAIPRPLVHQLAVQLPFEHLHHVLAQHREELIPVEGAARRDVEVFGPGVRRDDEVGRGGEGIPISSG